jgi:small GTP-binding protein
MLASGSEDGIGRIWDTVGGQLHRTLIGYPKEVPGGERSFKDNFRSVFGVAWSPDGQTIASCGRDENIPLWDAQTWQLRHSLGANSGAVINVAWSPDGRTLAAVSYDNNVRLWDAKTRQVRRRLATYSHSILSVAWSPDGQTLASGGDNETVRLWDTATGQVRRTLVNNSWVSSVVWSPDGETLAVGFLDGNVLLWNAKTGQPKIILEGHTNAIKCLTFSFDGSLIASKSYDGTVRLWRCDNGKNVAVLAESASKRWPPGLAFHPTLPVLATLGERDTAIRIWDLDFDVLLGAGLAARGVSYTNAKVVLVGETGVGKTGLGVRLAEDVWRPTPSSTHGMNVWTLHSEAEREVMLWDFAGQDEYRLVHQLFLNETHVALLLYDPTKSQDMFYGIDYWEKALRNAVPDGVQKILVAARVDVGGVRLTTDDIKDYCTDHGYLAHFATSAETKEGCDELRAVVLATIPWDRLPRTSSPEVFKRIKDFLAAVRQGDRVLVRELDLRAEFDAQADIAGAPTKAEFRTVIGHVETAGLIKRLSFGDFVLLKPELLNGYASAIVDAARSHHNGLGAVRKADVLDGHIKLKDEGGLNPPDKIFLLHATVELFLRLGLALEQDGNLVFPSKFNRRMPPLEEDPVVEVEFAFEGPVENLYTTLVVKLYYGGIFRLKKLWKNAAEFLNARERVCGFQLHTESDGHGTLKVFYAEGVSDDDKALFLKIIADHFKDKRVEVSRKRIYYCPDCRELVRDNDAVRRAKERKKDKIFCQDCGELIALVDALEMLYRDDQKFLSQIAAMESRAEASMELGSELVAASAELRTEDFKQWAGGADIATVAIVFTDVINSTPLNLKFGDEGWGQAREAHFAQAGELVKLGHGYLIKTIGDSVMAAFHSATAALDFALALESQTGHKSVKIRAGIHIGAVEVTSGDAFGQQVSMAARVEDKAKDGGIWVSAQVKEDIDTLRAAKHKNLNWEEHPNEELKGFPRKCTLWSVKKENKRRRP